MGLRQRVEKRKTEKMSDAGYRMMALAFKIIDFFYPYVKKRVKTFGIKKGMTVVDYGCGPGRYATRLAELVGEQGTVYALDIHELAIEDLVKRVEKHKLRNVHPILATGYDSTLPDFVADIVFAIDMFWIIKKPTEFLAELRRITKNDGTLIVDDGHQRRSTTIRKILDSGLWEIVEETKDHLRCKTR